MGNQPSQRFENLDLRGAQGFSFGDNSTNQVTNYHGPAQADELTRRLDELDQLIMAHQVRLRDVDDLRAAVAAIKEQTSGGRPSKGVLKTLMLGMTTAVSGVAEVAGAVERVRAALGV